MTVAPLDPAPPLLAGDAHVWTIRLDAAPPRLDELGRWLSLEERTRADRFHFARDRNRFMAGRGQLREVLARYLGRPPGAVLFAYGMHGKPRLADDGTLRFNLSHSRDVGLLAVARGRELGIDLEWIRPDVECDEIAQRFFSTMETAALMALPAASRPPAFFACWTRKEAFVKAKGGGLGIPLADFDVSVDPAGPARLLRTAWDPPDVDRWWLRALEVPPGFAAAMVVEGGEPRLQRMELS
jgi:4'-phosphopantetheinyl transferase